MGLAEWFDNWVAERAAEEMSPTERTRYNQLKEQLSQPLPRNVQRLRQRLDEIRLIESKYGLPHSCLIDG